jgi:hypothetical protein
MILKTTDGGGLPKPTGIQLQQHLLPQQFELKQNFPNPFNPSTTIQYSLPEASDVRIAVYNTLGEEAAVLVDGYQPAGRYSVVYHAHSPASGIYFYSLTAGEVRIVKKMNIAK